MSLLKNHYQPFLFAGPSIRHTLPHVLSNFIIKPPVQRGDLEKLLEKNKKPKTVIIIDGLYGSRLAVTPTECRCLLEAGWTLIGGASMGALRASELWSVGMIGIGDIYTLFRLGKLYSDAEVAVTYDKSMLNELTLSVVHLRSVLGYLETSKKITNVKARQLLLVARKVHWQERFKDLILDNWQCNGLTENLVEHASGLIDNPLLHPKIHDVQLIFTTLLCKRWPVHKHFNKQMEHENG